MALTFVQNVIVIGLIVIAILISYFINQSIGTIIAICALLLYIILLIINMINRRKEKQKPISITDDKIEVIEEK